jgi:hypothetical protein
MNRSLTAAIVPLPRLIGGRVVRNAVRDSLAGDAVTRSDDRCAKLARSDCGGIVNGGRSIDGGGRGVKLARSDAGVEGGGGQLARSLGVGGG